MRTSLFAISLSSIVLLSAAADAAIQRAGESSVSFTAAGPAGLNIVGTTRELTITDDGKNITFKVPLATVATGIALRDKHMREKYLNVDKFPFAELTVAKPALKMPAGGDVNATAAGTMTLHGQSKPVTLRYTATQGRAMAVTASVHLEMTDYGIEVPKYMGMSVKPGVEVAVTFNATEG